MLCQHLVIGDGVILHGAGIDVRVGTVNAVDVLGEQDRVRTDLGGAQHGGRVGRKIRTAAAGAEEHDLALFQMRHGALPGIVLGKRRHFDGRLHAYGDALLLHDVGHGQAVHDRSEHAHVVGARAGHLALAVFHTTPEVAAADDDAHLHTHVRALFDDVAHLGNDVEVEAEVLVARQRLAADLEQHALILELSHAHNLPFQEQVQISTATILAYFCSFA